MYFLQIYGRIILSLYSLIIGWYDMIINKKEEFDSVEHKCKVVKVKVSESHSNNLFDAVVVMVMMMVIPFPSFYVRPSIH